MIRITGAYLCLTIMGRALFNNCSTFFHSKFLPWIQSCEYFGSGSALKAPLTTGIPSLNIKRVACLPLLLLQSIQPPPPIPTSLLSCRANLSLASWGRPAAITEYYRPIPCTPVTGICWHKNMGETFLLAKYGKSNHFCHNGNVRYGQWDIPYLKSHISLTKT